MAELDKAKAIHWLNRILEAELAGVVRYMGKNTTIAKTRPEGSVVEVLADGSERPLPDMLMRPMTPEEVEEAARADPDARAMTVGKVAPRAARQDPEGVRRL